MRRMRRRVSDKLCVCLVVRRFNIKTGTRRAPIKMNYLLLCIFNDKLCANCVGLLLLCIEHFQLSVVKPKPNQLLTSQTTQLIANRSKTKIKRFMDCSMALQIAQSNGKHRETTKCGEFF